MKLSPKYTLNGLQIPKLTGLGTSTSAEARECHGSIVYNNYCN